jgi:hypothetical protein
MSYHRPIRRTTTRGMKSLRVNMTSNSAINSQGLAKQPLGERPPSIESQAASAPRANSPSVPEPASSPHLQSSSDSESPPGPSFTSPGMNTSGTFAHGHHDIVQAMHYNFQDTRMLTASSDHHIKVWNRKGEKGWELLDTWRGHDAEIMDVSKPCSVSCLPF